MDRKGLITNVRRTIDTKRRRREEDKHTTSKTTSSSSYLVPCLLKRVEATCGLHLCELWKSCGAGKPGGCCQYRVVIGEERGSTTARGWEEEIAVYRPFCKPKGWRKEEEEDNTQWSVRGLVSEAMASAQGQSILRLKEELKDANVKIQHLRRNEGKRSRSKGNNKTSEKDCREILKYMEACKLEAKAKEEEEEEERESNEEQGGAKEDEIRSSRRARSKSIPICMVGGGTQRRSKQTKRRRSKIKSLSPKSTVQVSPSILAAVPLLRKFSSSAEEVRTRATRDWPYRDIFPQFLRQRSAKRSGGLSEIMKHMQIVSGGTVPKDEPPAVASSKKKTNTVDVVSRPILVVALWRAISKRRRRILVNVVVAFGAAVCAILWMRRRPKISLPLVDTARRLDRGIASMLPPQSIFTRLLRQAEQPKSPLTTPFSSPTSTRHGIARFLPKESIFVRLQQQKTSL